MITCPICQTDNDTSATDCILCGAPLPETPASSSQKPASSAMTSGVPPFSPKLHQEANYFTPAPLSPSQQNLTAPPLVHPHPSGPANLHVAPSPMQDRLISHITSPTDVPSSTRSPELTMPTTPSQSNMVAEVPAPGTLCLIIYFQRRPAFYFPVIYDEIMIGRTDPASNAYPDLDVTPYDTELAISRKHCYLYRENNDYYIYPISNSGTQVNQEMIDIGTKRRLKEGDVLILSGRLAIRFARTP